LISLEQSFSKEETMNKIAGWIAIFCLLFAPALFAADPVKIGLMGPMTGSWASEGQEMKQVLDLLADEYNQQGGVLGRKIQILTQDDGGDPRTASLAANRLVSQKIVAVVGTYGSSITEATQNIYDEAGVVQVANGSTAIRLSEKGLKNFFRTCPRDDEQGKVATATIQKLGGKKVAILHDNTSYAKGLAEESRANLKAANVEVVFFDALTPGERDYNAILTKLKAAGPDFVFFTGYYPEAGLLLRQKKEMGWDVPFMGGDAVNNPTLVETAGAAAAEGFYFLSPPLPKDLDTPEAKSFVEAFTKKHGHAPKSIYPVLAGDGFRVLVEAIKATDSVEAEKISAYLKSSLKDFPGLTGTLAFDDKGDRVGEVYRVYKVDGEGQFILEP
jgi:branched-chain amino acid transport system substrate-binding protein